MAGYPVINPAGVDILNVDGTTTHYNQGETVPLSKLISRRYSWLVERGNLSETEIGFGGGGSVDLTDVEYIGFNTSSPYHTALAGQLTWNNAEGTLDLGLAGGNTTIQIGQEQVARIKNNTGSPLTNGQVVYINGSVGGPSNYRVTVALAQANAESTSSKTFGIVTESISNGNEGFVTTFGMVRGVNTSAISPGTALWLSPTTAGGFTATKPSAPNHAVLVGWCVQQDANGVIFVNIQNGYELDELHDVSITSKQDNDIITYDSALGIWKNQSLAAAIAEIDGAGSGLDADTLDGQHGSYYAPVNSPTFTGVATFQGYIDLVSAQLDSDLKSVSVTTALLLDAFDASLYRSAEYTIQLSQGSNYAMCKLLLIHNGTDVGITEYGIAEIGTSIPFTFSTNFSAGILELLITCSNANVTTVGVKFSRLLYDA